MFWFFGHKACGILAPRPGIKRAPPALEGEVLTTGLPGKSSDSEFNQGKTPHTLYRPTGTYWVQESLVLLERGTLSGYIIVILLYEQIKENDQLGFTETGMIKKYV